VSLELRAGAIVASRYRLDRLLGEGGFAVVWAATHVVTRRRVALKFLRESSASDPRIRQRFVREVRAASAVSHPNVIVIHDVFEDDAGPMMVMDLLEGESLGVRLARDRALSLQETATIMLPVVSAVETAHALGIVHRDLKPDNIFLAKPSSGYEGAIEVKVLDFGIAKLTRHEGAAAQSGGLTNTGAMLGTPYYMSPEQFFGDGEIDHRSDIWALGVILYECLAGVRPTEAETVGNIVKIIANEAMVPLADRKPGLPADVTGVVQRALSFDCAKRPPLRELAEVLARYTSVKAPSPVAAVAARAESTSPNREPGLAETSVPRVVTPPRLAASKLLAAHEQARQDARASTQAPLTLPEGRRRAARRVWPVLALGAAGIMASGGALVAWRGTRSSSGLTVSSAGSASFPASPPPVSPGPPAPVASVPQESATGASLESGDLVPTAGATERPAAPVDRAAASSPRDSGAYLARAVATTPVVATRPPAAPVKTAASASAPARPFDPGSIR
jgi:serine/threonine-protein kinase